MEIKENRKGTGCEARGRRAWISFCASRAVAAAADAATLAFAFFSAFALRLGFGEPLWGWGGAIKSFAVVVAAYLFFLAVFGCYSRSCRTIRLNEVPRFFAAAFTATVFLLALRVAMPGIWAQHLRPPYSVTAMTFVFAPAGFVVTRVFWRIYAMSRKERGFLAGRDEMSFDNGSVARFFLGKTVLVTGAGGSIGSEIVRQSVAAGAKKVLMVERSEHALYEIDREIRKTSACAVPLMRDILDQDAMDRVFLEYKPDVVIHAAAYKHVPMVELNPEEGWRNNVEGTRIVAEAAKKHGASRFVLVSTDKAVNPVSAMGKSKRAAEETVISLNGGNTGFCAVRFGNVYGSSGSVVPLFAEQISHGGPVTVTHPDMRRYFMTIKEAVSLVMQAASRHEGAIYTLDMGKSVRILDLAEEMIRANGLRPYVDIPVVFTGIRPGEKIFEEIDVSEKSAYKTDMAKIYITKPATEMNDAKVPQEKV